MFDTTDRILTSVPHFRILNQLRAGEDGLAEFKALRLGHRGVLSPDTEDLPGELVAFANAAGGAVFQGVDDSGAVAGIRSKRSGQVFLESRGEGVRKIRQGAEAHSGRRPEYELFGDELRLTLWAKSRPQTD